MNIELLCKAGDKMSNEGKQLWAIKQLCDKHSDLGRLPQKSDFDNVTLSRIKAFLGPWPRALEKAGLKEKREGSKKKSSNKRKKSKEN